jgi:hypothetical protein
LIAIREAFFVQLGDAVSQSFMQSFAQARGKIPTAEDIDARTILNYILIMSPSALVGLTVICDSLSTFCVAESHLARVLSRGKVFSHVKRLRCFS